MADCYVFARTAGARYGEVIHKNPPCGPREDTLICEPDEESPKLEEPVFVRD